MTKSPSSLKECNSVYRIRQAGSQQVGGWRHSNSSLKDDGRTSSNGSSKVTRKPLVRIMDAEVMCGDFCKNIIYYLLKLGTLHALTCANVM